MFDEVGNLKDILEIYSDLKPALPALKKVAEKIYKRFIKNLMERMSKTAERISKLEEEVKELHFLIKELSDNIKNNEGKD